MVLLELEEEGKKRLSDRGQGGWLSLVGGCGSGETTKFSTNHFGLSIRNCITQKLRSKSQQKHGKNSKSARERKELPLVRNGILASYFSQNNDDDDEESLFQQENSQAYLIDDIICMPYKERKDCHNNT